MKRPIKHLLKSLGLYTERPADPNWQAVLGLLTRDSARWKSACAAAKSGPRVLIVNSVGTDPGVTVVEIMLALALTLRGGQVHILVCDKALPACFVSQIDYVDLAEFVKFGPSRLLCNKCFPAADRMFKPLGLPTHHYSDLISGEDLQKARDLSSALPLTEIAKYRLDGVAVGEQALAGALRFYARGNLDGEPQGEAVLRRYFNGSLLTTSAIDRLLNTLPFTCVCALGGIYVPQGLIGEVARQQKVRVVNWDLTYRKQTFVFSHHDTYHHTLLSEPTLSWENVTWTPDMEADILDYLKSRWYGTRDWILYVERPKEDIPSIAAEIGVDFSKPCIGMLTNVMWDAQVSYRGIAFPNMLEWVLQTIRYFANRTDLQLIIRAHPAELRGLHLSRQPIIDEIRQAFPVLPKNVFLIPPDSSISTYAAMLKCDAVLIYATKTGVELTSMGIPVIVAGEAWIRNKGITLDASSAVEYFAILDRLPLKERLSEAITQRARKYAYHFFFRRMIPLTFMIPRSGWPPYELELSSIDDLLPGRSVSLDVICNGILNGEEFIYPAELHLEALGQ
ncbi:MAG: capsule biosynthesis protein [Candidatus Binatia bacterium]